MSAAGMAAAVKSAMSFGIMLPACLMRRISYVTRSIACFVALEVIERLSAAPRQWPMIAMMRIVAIIYMSIEAMRTVEPRTRADEEAASKPVWSIVAIGSAIIRGIIEVSIWADGSRANRNADLRRGLRATGQEQSCSKSGEAY